MKFLTPQALLAAALLSAAAVVPFLPAARKVQDRFGLEVRYVSSVSAHLQVYFDRGSGFNERDSIQVPVAAGGTPRTYRLNLPPGDYRNLRFDPLDRDGTVRIEAARISDNSGRTVRDVPLTLFKPLNQIQSLQEKDGSLDVVMVPGSNDPQLIIDFDPPLNLAVAWTVPASEWAGRAGLAFCVFALGLYGLDRSAGRFARSSASMRSVLNKPSRAISIVAIVAVAASAYPVIFLGKSFVSPNFGAVLLYDDFPTLPGYTETRVSDVKGSDVGAIMWQHIPYSMGQHRSLMRDGELPLWNRYNSAGVPMLGQGQSMFGDPLHLLVVAANGAAWAWDIKYLIAKWLFAMGLGLLVLAVTRHLPSSLLVGLAAPFVGFFVYRVNHPAFFSLCYAHWPLYFWVRATQASGRRATGGWFAALLFANIALIGSGTVKEAYMLLLTINFAGACVLVGSPAPWRSKLSKLAGAIWTGALFILISAPLWGSFLVTLKQAFTYYDAASAFQIQPGMALGAFDEAFYRPLSKGEMVFNPSANFLILAGLLYFLATLRHHFSNRPVISIAAASLLPLSMAFGLVPPASIVRLPFFANIAHIDNSFTCPLIILWAVLAGAGFAAAARRLGEREGRDDLIVAALVLFSLVFGFIAFRQAVHRSVFGSGVTFSPLNPGQSIPVSPFVWSYLMTLLSAMAAMGLTVRHALSKRSFTPASAFVLAVCIGAFLWRQGQQAGNGFADYVVHPPLRTNFHASSGAMRFLQEAQQREPSRSIGLQNNLFPGWTGTYGIESVSGPDALMNPYYRELTAASPLQRVWDWRLYVTRDNLAQSRPFLDFLNVRYYLDLKSDQGALGAVLKLDRLGDLDVYESPTTWPRAFFTDRISSYERPEQFVQQILQGDGRPFASALPGAVSLVPTLASLPDDQASRTVVPAIDYSLTENTTSFDIDAPEPGLVVLTEAYWAGYPHAAVDGHLVPVVRINHAFEGVAVDSPGKHHVTFSYRPSNFYFMLGISAAGLALLAGSAWYVRRSAA